MDGYIILRGLCPDYFLFPFGAEWSLHERQPSGCRWKPLTMAIKWASASVVPAAETEPTCPISSAATNEHADLNWLLYWFRPSPIYRKGKPFGSKCHRWSDWSLLDKIMDAHSVCWQQHCAAGLAEVDAHLSSTDSARKHPVDDALHATKWFLLAVQYQSPNSTAQNLSFTGRFSWANLHWNVIKRIRMSCAFNQISPISWYLVNPWCDGWRCYYPVSILDSLQELE